MKSFLGILSALASAPSASEPLIHGPSDVARQILEAERAVSDRATQAGPRRAFREFMDETESRTFADDGVLRGAHAIASQQADGVGLT